MITVTDAMVYSTNGEMAHQITYSDGSKVRAVKSRGNIIRQEYLKDGNWLAAGKPYVVNHNRLRSAERIVATVNTFLAA